MKNICALTFLIIIGSAKSYCQGPNIGLQLYGYQDLGFDYNNRPQLTFLNAVSVQQHFKPISVYTRFGRLSKVEIKTHRYVNNSTKTSQDYIDKTCTSTRLELGVQKYLSIKNSNFKAFFRLGYYWSKYNLKWPANNVRDSSYMLRNTQNGISSSIGLQYPVTKNIYIQAETLFIYSVIDREYIAEALSHKKTTSYWTDQQNSFSPILITVGVNLWNK